MALGQIDYHLFDPWAPLEQILYPSIGEFLAAWNTSQDAPIAAVRIVGHRSAARSHEVRDLLTRASVPYWFFAPDTEEGRQVLAEAGADGTRLPVMHFYSGTVLVDPSNADVVDVLGVSTSPPTTTCDVLVVGAGPAGLAAAVYAASEGLDTMVVEPEIPGGQAGTSSLIRNYLGFRHGISGQDLGVRASEQAWLFGVDFVLTQRATRVDVRGADRIVHTTDGSAVRARAVVLATGVAWRRLDVPALEALVGAGVFYGAAGAEARAVQGRDVVVVGGGNSAGQAAVHLARYARSVTMLVRGPSLAATMSTYLITEITSHPAISVRVRTEHRRRRRIGRPGDALTVVDHTTGRPATIPATGAVRAHRGGAAHRMAGRDGRAGSAGLSASPASWPGPRTPTRPGPWSGRRCCSRPASPASSRPGTCAPARSSGWLRRWAKGATAVRLVHAYLAGEYV